MNRHQRQRGYVARKWRSERARELEQMLDDAPGAKTPPTPMRKTVDKLSILDAKVKNCRWCGAQSMARTCSHCKVHGYPITREEERAA